MSCGPVNVQIQQGGSTKVAVQPFSVSAIKHAPSHYISGNDPVNHNNLSGLQGGGNNNEYYHLDKKSFDSISSGVASFISDLPSGITQTGILFPFVFSSIPTVHSNITSPYSTTYLHRIDSITTTGFHIYFSSTINNSGYKLQNLAYIIT
jgi:hypothetical protein